MSKIKEGHQSTDKLDTSTSTVDAAEGNYIISLEKKVDEYEQGVTIWEDGTMEDPRYRVYFGGVEQGCYEMKDLFGIIKSLLNE